MTRAIDELKMDVRRAIINKGSPVRRDPSTFVWEDHDLLRDRYARRDALDAVTTDDPVEDVEWNEFADTIASSRTCYGVEVTIHYDDEDGTTQTWRYEGSMSSLITEILR